MTKLSKNHPFIITARILERLERKRGVEEEVVELREKLQKKYPEYFREYMMAKNNKQKQRLFDAEKEKARQMKHRGCETVTYWKKKKEESKKKF